MFAYFFPKRWVMPQLDFIRQFYLLSVCFCLNICKRSLCVSVGRGQKRANDPLELELHVGAGN